MAQSPLCTSAIVKVDGVNQPSAGLARREGSPEYDFQRPGVSARTRARCLGDQPVHSGICPGMGPHEQPNVIGTMVECCQLVVWFVAFTAGRFVLNDP